MKDLENRDDIEQIVRLFYERTLKDPIIGFIFNDIAKIELEAHVPIVTNFWFDMMFGSPLEKTYSGNVLKAHKDLHQKVNLRAGHFTRWLYLFNRAVDDCTQGQNADRIKQRAEQVAKSISAALTSRSRSEMNLVLDKGRE